MYTSHKSDEINRKSSTETTLTARTDHQDCNSSALWNQYQQALLHPDCEKVFPISKPFTQAVTVQKRFSCWVLSTRCVTYFIASCRPYQLSFTFLLQLQPRRNFTTSLEVLSLTLKLSANSTSASCCVFQFAVDIRRFCASEVSATFQAAKDSSRGNYFWVFLCASL